jgi:hypothetical protein
MTPPWYLCPCHEYLGPIQEAFDVETFDVEALVGRALQGCEIDHVLERIRQSIGPSDTEEHVIEECVGEECVGEERVGEERIGPVEVGGCRRSHPARGFGLSTWPGPHRVA